MKNGVQIIRATPADAKAISDLITYLSVTHIAPELTVNGRRYLLEAVTQEKIKEYIADQAFDYNLAVNGSIIIGVVAIRNNSHLYHLFVADDWQKLGVARGLWEFAKARCMNKGNPGRFTVNSSHNARSVYLRFGFSPLPESEQLAEQTNDLRVTPMILDHTRDSFNR